MGRFKQADVDQLLVDCHRRCCICHRFCGVKIETDHMVTEAEGGSNDISNAIAVCFECHAEIHSYNDRHPRGRKFHSEELKKHKEQWLAICRERPSELLSASRNADVGPLQALIDELAFNQAVANANVEVCPFMVDQMKRAITEGTLSLVGDDVRQALLTAYHQMSIANNAISRAASAPPGAYHDAERNAKVSVKGAAALIQVARETLLKLLNSE
jgi:hypothetical protein